VPKITWLKLLNIIEMLSQKHEYRDIHVVGDDKKNFEKYK